MTTDVLSDVLRAVHLTGAVFFDFDLTAPWVLAAPPSRDIAQRVMPGAHHVIEYHLVIAGGGWARVADGRAFAIAAGDLVVVPRGDAHVLSSAPDLHEAPDLSAFDPPLAPLPLLRRVGGGERARVVCAFLGCDERPYNPMLDALPRVMHVRSAHPHAADDWLATLVASAAQESGRARDGRANVLARLSELLFVEAIRRYLETLPADQTGWLAGLRDGVVGHALAALHAHVADPWTVERLARHVGVSRSVLAQRFTNFVGRSPMQYLALWRMQLAARMLGEGARGGQVAEAIGYASEPAFSRAFKKVVGRPPKAFRSAGPTYREGVSTVFRNRFQELAS